MAVQIQGGTPAVYRLRPTTLRSPSTIAPVPLLTASNIAHSFGQRQILDGISLSLEPGERIGIVGRNGCGKSTLLKILAGLMSCDEGSVSLQRGSRAGYLHQDPKLDPDETLRGAAEAAFEKLHSLHRDLHEVYEHMATAQGDALDKLLKQQERLEREIDAAGGYAVDHKIDAVLHGLGFSDSQFNIPVKGLSGGQKGRVSLAKLLLEEPDVLLLDEPTNHLDIEGRLWLEDFLTQEYRGAVLMISHDRYLLDNVVAKIWEIEQGRLIEYPGNYEAFREIRALRRLTMMRAHENQQKEFEKERQFILKYKAGQRAKQARGRETRLERAKERTTLERPAELDAFRLSLPKAERSGDIVASAREVTKQYPADDGTTKVLFHDFTLTIGRGERWGIIGPNGAGKSTLVRCLLGEQPVDSGKITVGSRVIVGHFKQTHEHIDGEQPVYQYIQAIIKKEAPQAAMSEQAARDLAGAFLISGKDQDRPMGQLSGGERARAVLAGLLASAKNLLILDEPTNHLDIPSAERLEQALAAPEEGDDVGFAGTLILISHDRAMIDACCDSLLILDGHGNVEIFNGSYTEWHEKDASRKKAASDKAEEEREHREREEARAKKAAAEKAAAKPPAPKPAPSGNNKLARMSSEQIESRIAQIDARVQEIDKLMQDPDVWRDPAKCNKLGAERGKLIEEQQPLEAEYFNRGK